VTDGKSRFIEGTLFRLPPELQTNFQMDWYVNRTVRGWNKCPQGYSVYAIEGPVGDKYIIPGLNIVGEKRPTKKFYEASYFFSKDQIAHFANNLVEEASRLQKAKDEDFRDLINDLRALSSAIYNSAVTARDEYDIGQIGSARDRIETVIATQTMLSIRIDLLDYLSSQTILSELEYIEVFRKVDKVVRCFRPKAKARRINLELRGPSFAATYGPAIFELIPYAIVDNAVKYSPNRSDIIIQVEDRNDEILVRIVSLGPLIEPSESEKIFERGYRGVRAAELIPSGTGIGLYTAKELLQINFNGSISVSQATAPTIIDGHSYFSTQFEIVVPRQS